ncbi:hypothetical protein FNV43_RR24484 [Rhamnella rubrinervis]|uniref:RING-type domain-containing protein n=1 Tax=Rhamnella rubrinervis TaxID=2594499 RepID=A0A8K0DLL2_9ROSA|nr:hypothetical protein FNV43_RR24484 [Rhamnella rubrinervis]
MDDEAYNGVGLGIAVVIMILFLYGWCNCLLAGARRTSSKGLNSDAIKALPIVPHQFSSSSVQDECCVCLGVYENGERVKLLPCNHCYHPHCVDMWLTTHTTCPVCRAFINPQPNIALQIVVQ